MTKVNINKPKDVKGNIVPWPNLNESIRVMRYSGNRDAKMSAIGIKEINVFQFIQNVVHFSQKIKVTDEYKNEHETSDIIVATELRAEGYWNSAVIVSRVRGGSQVIKLYDDEPNIYLALRRHIQICEELTDGVLL